MGLKGFARRFEESETRAPGRWPWIGFAAMAGTAFALPIIIQHRHRRSYQRQDEWMNAYIRGCIARNRR